MTGRKLFAFALLPFASLAFAAGSVQFHLKLVTSNGQALTGRAHVVLVGRTGELIAEEDTNTGELDFSQIKPGGYRIVVSGPEIRSEVTDVAVSGGRTEKVIAVYPQRTSHPSTPGGKVSVAELKIPAKAEKEFRKATRELEAGKFEEARHGFLKALQIYPRYTIAYDGLGVVELKEGHVPKAREFFLNAEAIEPEDLLANLNLARIAYRSDEYAAAERFVRRVLKNDPANVQALSLLALVHFRLHQYEDSVTDAHEIHSVAHGKIPAAHWFAARALTALGRRREAEQEFQLFLEEEPNPTAAALAEQELESLQRSDVPATKRP